MATLVQKTAAGAFTSVNVASSTITQTAHYTSNTTAGSLLVCVVSAVSNDGASIGTEVTISGISLTTSGVTWQATNLEQNANGGAAVKVFYILNAASITSGTNTSTTVTSTTSATAMIVNVDLYEFSAGLSADASGIITGTGTDPGVTVSPLYSQELIFCAASAWSSSGNQGNPTAGSGYTLGNETFNSQTNSGNLEVLNSAQQYVLSSSASGSQSVVFGSTWQTWAASVVTFIINTAPTVTSCTPSSGTTAGGTSITDLHGTNFVATPTVTFGGTSATSVSFVSSVKLTCTTPAHGAGTFDVVVTNPDTQSGTLTNGYTYTAAAGTHEGLLTGVG